MTNAEVVEMLDAQLPMGWDHDAALYGMSFTLWCPDGFNIEQDGTCPDGHESPLMGLGLI